MEWGARHASTSRGVLVASLDRKSISNLVGYSYSEFHSIKLTPDWVARKQRSAWTVRRRCVSQQIVTKLVSHLLAY